MLFDESCTIFHFEKNDVLKRIVLNNKCYSHKISGARLDKGIEKIGNIKIIILDDNKLKDIKVGDLIVCKEIKKDYEFERDLRTNEETFMIQSIEKCQQGTVKHYELVCK